MDWLEEIDDNLKQTLKDYIKQGQFDKYEDTYKGLDIFRYNTVYGKNIITVITKESTPDEWPEFESDDIEKAYDWIDVYVDKGEDEADDFYFSFLYPDDPEDVPAKYLKEENESTSYDIDDDRVFDWSVPGSDQYQKDATDIVNYIVHNTDIIPETFDFVDIEIDTKIIPATKWQPEEYETDNIDYAYRLDNYDKDAVAEEIILSVFPEDFLKGTFTGKQLKDFLSSDFNRDPIDDYILDHFYDEAQEKAQEWYDGGMREDHPEYGIFEEVEKKEIKTLKEEKKEEKKMNLKEYLDSFDDKVDEEVEKIVDVFDVSYTIGDGPYQSIMVKADDPEEAAVKVKRQIKGADIVGVAAQLDPKGMMERGKPILEEITDDISVRDWYIKTFPNDELGYEIDDYIKFEDIQKALDEKKDVYEVIGVTDSIVRERLFQKLADLTGVSYDDIYEKWINSEEVSDDTMERIRNLMNKKNN